MIIELTGIPGSGKSTLANELAVRYGYTIVECNSYFRLSDVPLGRFRNIVSLLLVEFRAFLAATEGLVTSQVYRRILVEALRLLSRNRTPIFHKLNILRNTLLKIATHRGLTRDKDTIYVVDEGLTHLPQSLLVDGSDRKPGEMEHFVKELVELLPMPDILAFLDAECVTATRRLADRGHGRFGKKIDVIAAHLENAHFVARLSMDGFYQLHPQSDHRILTFPADFSRDDQDHFGKIAATIKGHACSE